MSTFIPVLTRGNRCRKLELFLPMDLCVFAACLYSTNSAIIMDNMYNNAALSSLCPRAMHLLLLKGPWCQKKNI